MQGRTKRPAKINDYLVAKKPENKAVCLDGCGLFI
jgi:hypothetical protein